MPKERSRRRPFVIELRPQVIKDMERIPRSDKERVVRKMRSLATEPRPRGLEKLGDDEYRVRQGDYRVIYRIDDPARVITVVRVGQRQDVYKKHKRR